MLRTERRPLPLRRWCTWGLVLLVAGSGFGGLEAWPLTGWRLFSRTRTPLVSRLEARAVAASGTEALIPFDRLPHGFSGSGPALRRMARQLPDQRETVCAVWANATARVTGSPVAAVRVYEVLDDLRSRTSRATLAWTCATGTR